MRRYEWIKLMACWSWMGGLAFAGSAPSEVSLPSYARMFLERSLEVERSVLERDKAGIDVSLAKDPYQSNLDLSLDLRRSESEQSIDQLVRTSNQSEAEARVDYLRSLRGGRQIKLGLGQSNVKGAVGSGYLPSKSLTLELQQSLRRNFNGYLDDLNVERAEAFGDAAQLGLVEQKIEACILGSKLYLNVFFEQKTLDLYQKTLEDAKRVFETFKDLRRQQHIREIDYLRAEQDFLAVKELLLDRQHQLNQAWILMERGVGVAMERHALKDPTDIDVNEFVANLMRPDQNITRKKLVSQLSAQKSLIKIEQQKQKSEATVGLSGGLSEQSTFVEEDKKINQSRTWVGVSLSMSLPLNDGFYNRSIEKQMKEAALVEQEIKIVDRQYASVLASFEEKSRYFEAKRGQSLQKWQVSKKELEASYRLLQSLQIDLVDYISDRSKATSHEIEYLNAKWQGIINALDFALAVHQMPTYCRG